MTTYRYVCFNCDLSGLVLHEDEVDVLPGESVTSEFFGTLGTTQFGGSEICGACKNYVEKQAMCRECGNAALVDGYDECATCYLSLQ